MFTERNFEFLQYKRRGQQSVPVLFFTCLHCGLCWLFVIKRLAWGQTTAGRLWRPEPSFSNFQITTDVGVRSVRCCSATLLQSSSFGRLFGRLCIPHSGMFLWDIHLITLEYVGPSRCGRYKPPTRSRGGLKGPQMWLIVSLYHLPKHSFQTIRSIGNK